MGCYMMRCDCGHLFLQSTGSKIVFCTVLTWAFVDFIEDYFSGSDSPICVLFVHMYKSKIIDKQYIDSQVST